MFPVSQHSGEGEEIEASTASYPAQTATTERPRDQTQAALSRGRGLHLDDDPILIDSAPSLDQLTINALTAADGAVIVTHTKKWSLDGLGQLLDTIGNVQRYYHPGLSVTGIIVNQHEERTSAALPGSTSSARPPRGAGCA